MSRSPLVTTEWMGEHLDDPSVVVAEIKYEPDIDDYAERHLPGAQNWYWRDLFWDDVERQFPTPARMAERLGDRGVWPDTTLVMYSGRNQYAAYGYWVAKVMCGHADARVLDGGRARWSLERRPMTTEVPSVAPVPYPAPRAERDDRTRVGRDEVLAGLDREGRVILDARYPPEYLGERVKPGDGFDYGAERYGRIPGARSLVFQDLMNLEDRTLKPPEELARMFVDRGAGPDQADEVIAYCRLSHRASLLWFTASEILGWDHVRVYDGSWTEWGSLVGVPIER